MNRSSNVNESNNKSEKIKKFLLHGRAKVKERKKYQHISIGSSGKSRNHNKNIELFVTMSRMLIIVD